MAEENLEPLITECPNCQTRFRVTEGQLQIAAGRVRCGACLTVFEGVDHLLLDDRSVFEDDAAAQSALDDLLSELGHEPIDVPDADPQATDPDAAGAESGDWSQPAHRLYGGHEEPSDLEPEELERIEQMLAGNDHVGPIEIDPGLEVEEVVIDQVAPEPVDDAADEPVDVALDTPVDEAIEAELEPEAPAAPIPAPAMVVTAVDRDQGPARSFVFGEERAPRRWWVAAALAAAAIALVAQVLWYQFGVWARDPDVRPLYGVICQVFGCELPIMRDVDSMLAQNLVVRSHPEVANALLVSAIIVNQAEFAQPFPVLELRFTALNGSLVAGRRFQPEEYLAGELAGATVMQAQTPIHVELAIEDPGNEAVNYFLSFR